MSEIVVGNGQAPQGEFVFLDQTYGVDGASGLGRRTLAEGVRYVSDDDYDPVNPDAGLSDGVLARVNELDLKYGPGNDEDARRLEELRKED